MKDRLMVECYSLSNKKKYVIKSKRIVTMMTKIVWIGLFMDGIKHTKKSSII